MTTHNTQEQDLRTALVSDDVRHLDPELWAAFDKAIAEGIAYMMQEDGYEGLTSPSDVSQGIASECLAEVLTRRVAALAPKPTGTKAGRGVGADQVEAACVAYHAHVGIDFATVGGRDAYRDRKRAQMQVALEAASIRPRAAPGLIAALKDVAGWLENEGRQKHARHVRAGIQALAGSLAPDDEQIEVWSGEIVGNLAMGGFLLEGHTYEDTIAIHRIVADELKSICAATPTPPVSPSPDSTGPAGAGVEVARAAFDKWFAATGLETSHRGLTACAWHEAWAAARAALTPSASIAAPVRDDGAREALQRFLAAFEGNGSQLTEEQETAYSEAAAYLDKLAADRQPETDALWWAVERWRAEVQNRPLRNVHRRSLDTTWRQVIRRFGGLPDALVGPSHDDLVAALPTPASDVPGEAQTQEGGR